MSLRNLHHHFGDYLVLWTGDTNMKMLIGSPIKTSSSVPMSSRDHHEQAGVNDSRKLNASENSRSPSR